MQKRWHGSAVRDNTEAPDREDLDVWQRFMFDILDLKAKELEDLDRQFLRHRYKALRLICAGSAGSGKSMTIRSIVKRRRYRAERCGKQGDDVAHCCALAAPTGCAAFQMKFGAATAHRVFGVPVAAFRRMNRMNEVSEVTGALAQGAISSPR